MIVERVHHHRSLDGRVQHNELVAPLPGQFAHQLVCNALFGENQANLAGERTERELVNLPHRQGNSRRNQEITMNFAPPTTNRPPELVSARRGRWAVPPIPPQPPLRRPTADATGRSTFPWLRPA